jgi:hypothetical protein
MPNIENLEKKPFTKDNHSRLLTARREEILYREDIKTAFGYSVVGIAAVLALTGAVYVIGKQLIK